ncbi:MAG: helix-turn-helix domain-containing protein [Lachnospiraceae bacterium]|nr:helix-turn-helix domain-containing protein [Lachnospiraceae bacterium]
MKQFGDRLRDARERLDLKQTDVANATHINNKILSGYERNISQPSLENLKTLCEFYNISADEIIDIHPKKRNSNGEEAVFLTPEQRRLLSYFDKLNQENRDAIIGLSIVYSRDQTRKNTFQ